MDAASTTIGRGGLRIFDQLRDRSFPSLRRLQEFCEINLSAVGTGRVRCVIFWSPDMAADHAGDGCQIVLAGLWVSQPLRRVPPAAQPNASVRVDVSWRRVEVGRCVPPQHERFSELRHNPEIGDVRQNCAELRRETWTTLFKLVEVFLLRNGE